MRKLNLLLLLILIVAFSTTVFAQKLAILKPTVPGQTSDAIPIDKNTYMKLLKNEISEEAVKTIFESTHMGVIDTINYVSTDANVNWGVQAGDTNLSYYEPPAACYIKAIGIVGQVWGTSPLAPGFNLMIHKAAHPWVFPLAKWDVDGMYTRDSLGYSTLLGAEMWGFGGFPVSIIDGERVWAQMNWLGEEPDSKREGFLVTVVPYGNYQIDYMGTDAGYVDEGSDANNPARLAKFYQAGRSGHDPQFTVRHYCCTWLIVVEFYENTGPKIEAITQLASTYFASEPSPVGATITDIDASNAANAGVKDVYLVWTAKGATDSVKMTAAGDVFTGTLPAVSGVGEVLYWVAATDKGSPSLRSTSMKYSFDIVEPANPKVDLLLVFQGQSGAIHNPDFYRDALDKLGYQYEEWDAVDRNGITAAVTGQGWGTILIAGWGANTVPTRSYTGNPYAAFLNGGGKLFLSDMDYFFGNGEPGAEDLTFVASDFAYDFFGLAGGVSDPAGTAHLDSVVTGVAGDAISGDWATTPINLSWYRYSANTASNWTDYITVGSGTKIFTAESGNDVGVRYQGSNFKTVFLSFMADAAGDSVASPDIEKLLQNVLTWFETKKEPSAVQIDRGSVVNTYSLQQNYPNPFNPTTSIEYSIPEAARVNLTIYNVLGKKIAELVNEHQKPGIYRVNWDAKNSANGVYFYKLETGNYSKTMKMLLLR